jgi:hypothetical protein
MRRAVLTAAILACALGLAACNDGSSKTSSKTGNSGTTAAPKGGSGMTSGKTSGKHGTPLAGTDPCALFKPADLPDLKQDPDHKLEEDGGMYRSCAGDNFAVAIIDNDQDAHVMDFEGSLTQPVPDVAGHHAAEGHMELGSSKSCAVSMDVTADEYVRVGITSPEGDLAKACDMAMRAATVVAGRLPA